MRGRPSGEVEDESRLVPLLRGATRSRPPCGAPGAGLTWRPARDFVLAVSKFLRTRRRQYPGIRPSHRRIRGGTSAVAGPSAPAECPRRVDVRPAEPERFALPRPRPSAMDHRALFRSFAASVRRRCTSSMSYGSTSSHSKVRLGNAASTQPIPPNHFSAARMPQAGDPLRSV